MTMKRTIVTALSAASLVLASGLAFAAGQYGPGASDIEIKIGNTMPYSGPASNYGAIGQSDAAYFAMINERGGINGRKINFISRDDGYSPPKTVEQVRRLVEQDRILLLFNTFGTPPNTAVQGYLNDNKVPQLFVATGANKWNDPKHYPWTIGWPPSDRIEARIWARYILKSIPDAKIAVLYQNDDFGMDYLIGLREGLGDKADKLIVAIQSYETTDATVDSQIVALHGSGANVLLTAAILMGQDSGVAPAELLKPLKDSWPTYSGDYSGKRYSALTQINQSNVTSKINAPVTPGNCRTREATRLPSNGSLVIKIS